MKKKIYIICPVRNLTEKEKNKLDKHLHKLWVKGYDIHYPPRDTDQVDPIGFRICSDNFKAIKEADEVHVYWNSLSRGSIFDLGMAFALKKPILLINHDEVKRTNEKSLTNVLLYLSWCYFRTGEI